MFTANDLPRLTDPRDPAGAGLQGLGHPPLATDKVRFVGEAIAACLAPTRAEAEDLASLVTVDYELLAPIIDACAVLDAGEPVHDSWSNNLFIERMFEGGDIEEAARKAEVVVRANTG